MHIGLVSPSWPPGRLANGIVTYTSQLRQELQSRGHKVTIFAHELAAERGTEEVRLIRKPSSVARYFRKALGGSLSVFDAGKAVAASILDVHRSNPLDVVEMEETFGLMADVQRSLDIPVVVKLHGPGFLHLLEEEARTEFGQRRIAAEGAALAHMRWITAPSQWTLSQTLQRFSLRPLLAKVVANPLGEPRDLPLWDGGQHGQVRMVFVGRFDRMKGADTVFSAFARLAEVEPTLHLDFVGPDRGLALPDGRCVHIQEFINRTMTPTLSKQVSYHGFQDSRSTYRLRAESRVVVVPSRQESQGYTAVEAMLQGCPVVCSANSGLDELIEEGFTGLKARTGDADHFAQQIRRVLDDSALARSLGRAARQQVLARHNPAVLAEKTLGVYRTAINQMAEL